MKSLIVIVLVLLAACGRGPSTDEIAHVRNEKAKVRKEMENIRDQKKAIADTMKNISKAKKERQ